MKKLPQMIRSLAFFLSVCMVLSCVYLPGVTVRVSAAEPTVTTIFSENFEDETETLSGWTFQGYNSTANRVIQALLKVGVIQGVKEMLAMSGLDYGQCRKPFLPLTQEAKQYLYENAWLPLQQWRHSRG